MGDIPSKDCSGAQPDREKWQHVYGATLTCLAREDGWIHNRLLWSIQVNAAIVAGIFIFVATQRSADKPLEGSFYGLMIAVSLFSMVFTAASWLAIRAAFEQVKYLKSYITAYAEKCSDHVAPSTLEPDQFIEFFTSYPRPFGNKAGFFRGGLAPQLFSGAIIVAWIAVLFWSIFMLH